MPRILILALSLSTLLPLQAQFNPETNLIYGGNAADEAKDFAFNPGKTAMFFGARSYSSDVDVPDNFGGSDYWIMKRNLDGSLVWSKNFGAAGNDDLEVIMPHTDGGVLAFGTTHTSQGLFGTIGGLAGGWLMRTNANGSLIDGKIFGGAITETAVDAYRQVNGEITLLMSSTSGNLNGQFNHGLLDVWVVHVSNNFDILWSSLLGASGNDVPMAMTQDASGNVYVVATSDSNLPNLPMNHGGEDVWIIKLGTDGTILWQKSFGGSGDDIPTDIIVHPNGKVYVTLQSNSNDGDFGENAGLNDLWLLQLDGEDGEPIHFSRYGGSKNDFNARLDRFEDDKLVISATTTSEDGDLTGNKGLTDIWIFTTTLNGNLRQQMNYGGSLNDAIADITAVDSVFHILASTFSTDKNVPVNAIAQQDLWYFTLNTNPDTCSFQFICTVDTSLNNELFPLDNNTLLCVSGCTAGYGPGPDFINTTCPDFDNATVYFKVKTDTMAELLTLSVSSFDFNKPRLAIFKTNNCNTFQEVHCATGEAGLVSISYLEIQPLTTYMLAISDDEGNIGEFELCASSLNIDFCNEGDRIYATHTSKGSPLSGPYLPGEEVTICYELYDWNKLSCNGFQGLVPSFGPGWDSIGFDLFGMPLQIDTLLAPVETGFWEWYQTGSVHYNISNPINGFDSGQGMPAGWYFTNTGDPPPATKPDETTGDINNCLPTPDSWKVCFTLPVVDDCSTNLDCSVSMKTFADGELGINPSLTCVYDQPEVFNAYMVCCLNPSVENIQNFSICSGDTISFFPETNLLQPVTYTWTADPDPLIHGAASAVNAYEFYQNLTSDAAIPLKVRYSIRAQNADCITDTDEFEVTVLPNPRSTIGSVGPTTVCSGSTVTLSFQSLGTAPFVVGVYKDNDPFIEVLSESSLITIPVDPESSGRFTIGDLRDANCEGTGIGFVDITVLPVQTLVVDTAICEGASFVIGDSTLDASGTYSILLPGQGSNHCDSLINVTLNVIPSLHQQINETICQGDTLFVLDIPYTQSTSETIEYLGPEGCPNYIQLDLVVKDTFTTDIEQTICFGDTIDFEGIKVYQAGTYAHVEEIQPGCFQQTVLHLMLLPEIHLNGSEIMPDHGGSSGAILIEVVGGAPPYTYKWSSGQMTESLFNISQGHYSLTVTDQNACTQKFEFDVPFMTGTVDAESLPELRFRPTMLAEGSPFFIINTGRAEQVLSTAAWISLSGEILWSTHDLHLLAESYTSFPLPDRAVPGMYILKLVAPDGRERLGKVVLTGRE